METTLGDIAPATARPPAPESANPCATCGACCRSYVVQVCGHDIWQISSTYRLAPERFLVAYELPTPSADGFKLGADGPSLGLMLDKRGKLALKRACVFLLDLGGGHSRCGIYGDRPVVCRAYPMVAPQGHLGLRPGALCAPGAWSDAQIGQPAWRVKVARVHFAFDVYRGVVAQWNERVADARGTVFTLSEYLSYIFNVYAAIASLESALGPEKMDRIALTWRHAPSNACDLEDLRDQSDRYPWVDYLFRLREIVERYYRKSPNGQLFQGSVPDPRVTTGSTPEERNG
jgi:Fe-S-cluster containining protein